MGMEIDEVKAHLQQKGIHYLEEPDGDGYSSIRIWMPLRAYRFADRQGLSSNIALYEDGEYIRFTLFDLYDTQDPEKIPDLFNFVNRMNYDLKVLKYWYYENTMGTPWEHYGNTT